MITPIDAQDISKITSGQVIIELVSVAKELIDNAIDAGANRIEITFGEYGTKFLEVADNGCGIDPTDYEALCLKYHTSKLSSFEDLALVSSLGFRGEAMSSLCSVATVAVSTSSAATFPRGIQLQYDNMGKLTSKKSSVTGKKGTTVTITDLFRNLPVRHVNFVKHSKREYSKAVSLVMAYALAYTEIRFTLFSVNAVGKRQMVMGTPGGLVLLKDAMVNVYGRNGAHGLIPLEIKADNMETQFKLKLEYAPSSLSFKLLGAISDSSFGMGRSATDRQFLSINKRPVIHKRLSKVINEVYRSFNTTQSPMFVLDLQLGPHFLDVNVTPDKRSVMVHTEELILDVIREELTEFYATRNNLVPKSRVGTLYMAPSQNSQQTVSTSRKSLEVEDTKGTESQNSNSEEDQDKEEDEEVPELEVTTMDSLFVTEEEAEKELTSKKRKYNSDLILTSEADNLLEIVSELDNESEIKQSNSTNQIEPRTKIAVSQQIVDDESFENFAQEPEETSPPPIASEPDNTDTQDEDPDRNAQIDTFSDINPEEFESDSVDRDSPPALESIVQGRSDSNMREQVDSSESKAASPHLDTTKGIFAVRAEFSVAMSDLVVNSIKSGSTTTKDLAALRDITQTMEIRKKDFCTMNLVGQFNSGFIIVTHQNRLFIVDQHALDEIYNYERLMKSLVLRAQPLVVPRTLELSPIEEMRALEYADQLRKNGFQIEEDKDAAPGRKVRLVAVPVLKNVVFDDADLHELVNKLHENCSIGEKAAVRCTKTERTIALRACRLSIMIGLALLSHTMSRVVLHLSTLDRPWNCPHGRPTIRHLADLEGQGFQEDYLL